jgi:hypothetical protein
VLHRSTIGVYAPPWRWLAMGPIGGIQTAEQRAREEERYLKAAKEAFPGWSLIPVFAGWLAVPEGTPVIQSADIDGLVAKLRERERQ